MLTYTLSTKLTSWLNYKLVFLTRAYRLNIVYYKPMMVPISKDYLEKLSVQELVHLIKTQNGSFENEFQKLDDDSELVSCTEAEQMASKFRKT
ncbi:hypothetical protein BpHYR1_010620 [Brachionus plicatilis]|uniref:Uncharacterized protein n=1 Tax=Brachionus plicatilis TaxID=10195 RepID=A0A3M7S6P8_BRAPC|nr:hypothetical protein BpHYR1_010620 [Brachionus plicatilis]